jgi:ELWxxDGT repeat protein
MRRIGVSLSLVAGAILGTAIVTATDPLIAEPRMVGDTDAGRLYVEDATVVGDDFVFLGTHGRERLSLRWFDAERERERRVAVVWSGEMPRELATDRGRVIFTGFREEQGTEPWRSDGTRAGTKLVREIHTGRQSATCAPQGAECGTFPAGSDPRSFVTIGRTTFLVANHPRYGQELWRTNGTRAGTRLVKDIQTGTGSGLAFSEGSLVEFGGGLYFVAGDGKHGRELWRTDGTRAGTRMVRDIGPGWSVAWWDTPVVAGDHLYFTAEREDEGLELWRTDGTRTGTRLVRDIWPGPKASKPQDLTAVGDRLYFTARDREHGRELWRSDGTRTGTELVADIVPGRASSDLGDLVALGDRLYLTVWGAIDEAEPARRLWRTDEAGGSLEPVLLGNDGSTSTNRRWSEYPTLATHDGHLYLAADDGVHGNEVWVIDGATGASALVADIRPGPQGSKPEWLTIADTVLYVAAADGEHGRQLWALPLDAGGADGTS